MSTVRETKQPAFDLPVGQEIRVAADTEFQGEFTLTAQFAARVGDAVAVQVYHTPAIYGPPASFARLAWLPDELVRLCGRVLLRPARPFPTGLSPVTVLADLFGRDDL